MRFLFEKVAYNDILQAKKEIETQKKIDYNELSGASRNNFILDCINSMQNKKVLKKAYKSIVDSIIDCNWSENDFIKYINWLPENLTVDDEIISIIYKLMSTEKIKGFPKWLTSSELYNRSNGDIAYTIKALTLADNPELQVDSDGHNKYFDKALTVEDLYRDGKLLSAQAIENILNSKQTKDIEASQKNSNRSVAKEKARNIAKSNNLQVDSDKLVDELDIKTKNDVVEILTGLGEKKTRAREAVEAVFEHGDSNEDVFFKASKYLGK